MGKKAVVAISFGTTYKKAREAIEKIENSLKNKFCEYDFFRAFTSNMVIKKIKEEENIIIKNPHDLMEQLLEMGYTEVICQSLHIIAGFEYEKMVNQLYSFKSKFDKIYVGAPMLFSNKDYEIICCELIKRMPKMTNDDAYVYMGHGTEHFANSVYSQIENMFRNVGAEHVYVGTVEGFPDINYVIKRLKKHNIKNVTISPFMIVAGDHAQNDLASNDDESWKSILIKNGFNVRVNMEGLGNLEAVCNLFCNHLKVAKEI